MKIRFLIANAYVGGGTARTTLSTASALADRGHEVEIVSVLRRRKVATFPVHPRVRIRNLVDEYSLKHAPAPRGIIGRVHERWRDFAHHRHTIVGNRADTRTREWTLYTDLALVRWLRSVDDGVVVGTRPAINLAIARLARPRVVRVAQDHMNLDTYRPRLRSAMRDLYPRLDAVVTLTERDARDYEHFLDDGTRVLSIPNGVPDLGGHVSTVDRKVVIAAGRLSRQKGYDRLLPVWKQIVAQRPDWRLEIYGAGPAEDALRAQLGELGLQDSAALMGRTSELFARMAESSIFVMTSRREGMPMVLLEAMGVGLPVVSYDCPTGPRDLISDGVDGYVVPDGDEPALAARIVELMDDEDKRRRFAAEARAKADGYRVSRLAARWEQLFVELAETKRTGSSPSGRLTPTS